MSAALRLPSASIADMSVWEHRTSRGSYLGDAEGRPLRLGALARLREQIARYRDTIVVLSNARFRAAHSAQTLGVLWPMAYPTVLMIVMSFVFGYVFETPVEGYPVLLMLGLVPWHFVTHGWTGGMHSLLTHGDIVKRTAVPPWVVIAARVRSDVYNLGFSALSILPLVAIYPESFRISPALLLIPFMIVCLIALVLGLALGSAVLHVLYRDTNYIVDSALIAAFWATPIIYSLDQVPGVGRTLMHLNPMATIVEALRAVVVRGELPAGSVIWSASLGSLAVLVLGILVYRTFVPAVSDHV